MNSTLPKVISFSANKGGVGKTRTAILTANCLGSAGKKVLVIDMDFNNSATYYYLDEDLFRQATTKNIADALSKETNNLSDFTLPTLREGVDLIASSRFLADLRAVNEKRLVRMMPTLAGVYDFVLIDCQPTYDNLTLNALNASDVIITPVLKDLDSYNAACFLEQKIASETDKIASWYITINGYNRQYEKAVSGKQREYIDTFITRLQHTEKETWYPWTSDMNELKDLKKMLCTKPIKGAVCNSSLYKAAVNLAECFVDEEHIVCGEAF
jgi:chromosome partitioning protein